MIRLKEKTIFLPGHGDWVRRIYFNSPPMNTRSVLYKITGITEPELINIFLKISRDVRVKDHYDKSD